MHYFHIRIKILIGLPHGNSAAAPHVATIYIDFKYSAYADTRDLTGIAYTTQLNHTAWAILFFDEIPACSIRTHSPQGGSEAS